MTDRPVSPRMQVQMELAEIRSTIRHREQFLARREQAGIKRARHQVEGLKRLRATEARLAAIEHDMITTAETATLQGSFVG